MLGTLANPIDRLKPMFPLRDENPTVHFPIATVAIIALNIFCWVVVQGLGTDVALARSLCNFGLVTGDVLGTAPIGASFPLTRGLVCVVDQHGDWYTLFTHMFMHGGWLHIVGNLWFLWIFGDNVEDVMGPLRFFVFYLLCGLAAASAQMWSDVDSVAPMVGASGAIGGVMGAYALLFPRARVHTFIFLGIYMTTVAVPAVFMLGYWFVLQLLGGLPAVGGTSSGGVAFWAHVGGFLGGVALVVPFRSRARWDAHAALAPRQIARHRW